MSRFRELVLLLNFVNRKLPIDRLFSQNEDIVPVSYDELPEKSKKHEKMHFDAWLRYGVKANYGVTSEGIAFVFPNPESAKKLYVDVGHNKFIEILTEVVLAPHKDAFSTDGTDKKQLLILRKEITTEEELLSLFIQEARSNK